jgi:hypothetical protein
MEEAEKVTLSEIKKQISKITELNERKKQCKTQLETAKKAHDVKEVDRLIQLQKEINSELYESENNKDKLEILYYMQRKVDTLRNECKTNTSKAKIKRLQKEIDFIKNYFKNQIS